MYLEIHCKFPLVCECKEPEVSDVTLKTQF